MTAANLLHDLHQAGISVAIAYNDPTALDMDGPPSVLTPARLDVVRRHKSELLAILHRRNPRRHVAELIRDVRLHSADEAVAMRDAWRERMAACTIDGGLPDDHAEKVALGELENMLYCKTSVR